MRERYFFADMDEVVRKYVRACPLCQMANPRSKSRQGQLTGHGELRLFDRVYVDLIDFSKTPSRRGDKYILVIIDGATRYAETVPLENKDASTVSQAFLLFWILRHGTPRSVICDQGREFANSLFSELSTLLGMKVDLTPPDAYPKGTAVIDRFCRTLEGNLRKAVQPYGSMWGDHLVYALSAYNTAVHSSTGFAPFFLVYGRRFRMPLDQQLGLEDGSSSDVQWFQWLLAARARAELTSMEKRQKRIEANASGRLESTYSVGDLVLCEISRKMATEAPEVDGKLALLFSGPFFITALSANKRMAVLRYVSAPDNPPRTMDVALLKPFVTAPPRLDINDLQEPSDLLIQQESAKRDLAKQEADNILSSSALKPLQDALAKPHREREFIIDTIFDRRTRNDGRTEYLVHFQGYPSSDNEWVHDVDAPELIQSFLQREHFADINPSTDMLKMPESLGAWLKTQDIKVLRTWTKLYAPEHAMVNATRKQMTNWLFRAWRHARLHRVDLSWESFFDANGGTIPTPSPKTNPRPLMNDVPTQPKSVAFSDLPDIVPTVHTRSGRVSRMSRKKAEEVSPLRTKPLTRSLIALPAKDKEEADDKDVRAFVAEVVSPHLSEFKSILDLLAHTIYAGPAVYEMDWTRTWAGTLPPVDLTSCPGLVLLMRTSSASVPELQEFLVAAAPVIESIIRLRRPFLYTALNKSGQRRPQLVQCIVALMAELASHEAFALLATASIDQRDDEFSASESNNAAHASIQRQGGSSSNSSSTKVFKATQRYRPSDISDVDSCTSQPLNLTLRPDRTGLVWIEISNAIGDKIDKPRRVVIHNMDYWVLPNMLLFVATDDGRYEYRRVDGIN